MSQRNVVLVTSDSVRADQCGFLSAGQATTPVLDGLASDAVVFENAIAPGPQTLSSVPAVHTGTPFSVTDHDITDYQERINRIKDHLDANRTIAERFKERGYSTGCIEANPWTTRASGFDKGYDVFHDVGGELRTHVSERFADTPLGPPIRLLRNWYHQDGWFSRWQGFYERIRSTIENLPEPYFVWIFLLDTHNPYLVGKQDRVESSGLGMYYGLLRANSVFGGGGGSSYSDELPRGTVERVKRAYRDSIRSVDRFVGKLLTELSDDDPVMAFYSDHGEGFGEHGLYGHQHALYEENIHVPLLLHNAARSERVSEPVSLLQLPGLLEEVADEGTISPSNWTDEYVFSRTEDDSSIAVRGERWKYLAAEENSLFDLRNDPLERYDQSDDEPQRVTDLKSRAEAYLDSIPRARISGRGDDHEELEDRLDALGYVG